VAAGLTAPPLAASPADEALTVYSAGLEGLLVDNKDAGLKRALLMLDERVAELPAELQDPEMPGPMLQLAVEMLQSPMNLRAGLIEGADPMMGPPFWAQLAIAGSDAQMAKSMADRLEGFLSAVAPGGIAPHPEIATLKSIDLDGVPAYFGAIDVAGRTNCILAVNRLATEPLQLTGIQLPAGVQPAMAFSIDFQKMQPLLQMLLAQAGPDAAAARIQLEMMGMLGENASAITAAVGHGKDRSHAFMRYARYKQILDRMHAVAEHGLIVDDLKIVPVDATYAQVTKADLKGSWQWLRGVLTEAAQQAGGPMDDDQNPKDIVQELADQTGIHLERDIIDHLGQSYGFYMSEATGGGGLLSAVGFVEVTNVEGLRQGEAKVVQKLNELAAGHAKGYVQVRRQTIAGKEAMVLTFPGLPIPLELSSTMVGKHYVFAATPQGLQAAIAQIESPKSSLVENESFKQMGGSTFAGALQVTFNDTPALARNGYGMLSLAMSALSNAVRSPSNATRDAGVIMPSYHELMADAKASVMIARLDGEDLVATCQMDRSMLVNACGAAGSLGGPLGAVVVGSMAAGVMLPALGKARESARSVKSSSQVRQIIMSAMVHAAERQDRLPASLDAMIEAQYFTPDLLRSPFGPVPDGGRDYWMLATDKRLSEFVDPAQTIYCYDRAMYVQGGEVAVGFLDGHIELLEAWDFRQRIQQEPNAGVDFEIPFE
jgi:hypothetical protein